ncbi:hypothetical protein PG997_000539 [Apiospora hydei]|uniref:Rhodopsin domain-containing protein n=1 Tax=Apiospora hydei TaxID=1337664 RepID=A0ABR1XB47_9PEZI
MSNPKTPDETHPSTARVDRDTLLGAIWSLTSIAILLVAAHLSIRLCYSHRRLFADDYLAVLALLLLISNSVVMTLMAPTMYEVIVVSAGPVVPPPPTFLDDAAYYLELQFASTVLFWSCLWAVKGCFLVFFGRLARPLKWPRAWIAIVIFTVAAYCASIVTSLVLKVECQGPLNIYRSAVSLRFSTAVDVISDVLITCLPVYLTVGLQMSAGQKVGLVAVLSLGGIITVFALVRVVVTGDDATRLAEISWLALWSAVESSVASMAGQTTKIYTSKSLTSRSGSGGPQVVMAEEAELDEFTGRIFSRKAIVARAFVVEVGSRTASQERILDS